MKRLFLACLLCAAPLPAQLLDWGVRGGIPMNDAFNSGGDISAASRHWTLGPTAEINLPYGFGLEADMLYRRVGYTNGGNYDSNSWSFPILAKYKFPGKTARLFVDAGFAARHIGDVPHLLESGNKGFVLGAGFRYDLKLLKISPELRWTRWNNDQGDPATGSLSSKLNQAEFLIGVTF